MAYNRTYWVDHVTDQAGKVIQQGTFQDQHHFNNMEVGLSDLSLAQAIMAFKDIQEDYNIMDELHTMTLEQTGLKWPFNNKENTVALVQLRENTNYSVEVAVLGYSGGRLGAVRVLDRARNGFKLLHDGSATTVRVAVRISGGMTDQRIAE